jgi:uncharacterized membrane protein
MHDLLRHVFGWVCGQNPAHTWSPGGELLPVCQRCTGVYTGALVAALLHLAWRPVPTARWLWLNGAFLLVMVPAGFYWIPQNPELRCASGTLYGFGLVAFLWLTVPHKFTICLFRHTRPPAMHARCVNRKPGNANHEPPRAGSAKHLVGKNSPLQMAACVAGLLSVVVFTPPLAEHGAAAGAGILSAACAGGALALAALLLANVFFLLRWLARRFPTAAA